MDPKFAQAVFGSDDAMQIDDGDQEMQHQEDNQAQMIDQGQNSYFVKQQQMGAHGQIQEQNSQNTTPATSQFVKQLCGQLNLSDLPDTLSFLMTAGGVVLDKRKIKLDNEGYVDMESGTRYQQILKTDLEFGEILGQGNGGMVRSAVHKVSGTPVAVKIINLFDKDKRHQFYNEFDMIGLMQNNCPTHVQYYGVYFDQGLIHLVMEYMDGGSIDNMLSVEKEYYKAEEMKTRPLIPEHVIARFAWHLLQALANLHDEKNQIHRDLKPDNILVESTLGLAKLSDFGISRKLSDQIGKEKATTVTYTGTLSYMSPERLMNQEYSYPCDIWSLGVVLFEMATGRHPYPSTSREIEVYNFVKDSPAPTLKGSTIHSVELANFLARCLQKDPDQRATARELIDDPFIQFFLVEVNNDDHITWLKEYKERQQQVKMKNQNQQIDLASLGL